MNERGSVLIVGGGITGIQSAIDLSQSGLKVHIVEKNSSPGGLMAQLEKTFPTHDCSFCLLEPKLITVGTDRSIDIITNSHLEALEGQAGSFKATISENKVYIDASKCNDCGECLGKCKERAITRTFAALSTKVSALSKVGESRRSIYIVDEDLCTECDDCKGSCKEGAIIINAEPVKQTLEVQSIILSPGFKAFDPSKTREFGYGSSANVITSLELERMFSAPGSKAGLVTRPSDNVVPKKVAFIQCVGSRDQRTNTYCSSICCMAAIKEAILLVERYKTIDPTIFHMDIRAFGKEFEDFYRIAKERYNVNFINSRVANVEGSDNDDLMVTYTDDNGRSSKERFDLVVLSVGLVPPSGSKKLAKATGIELDRHGFALTSELTPLESSVKGILCAGAFTSPKDIPDSVCDASGAALLASVGLKQGEDAGIEKVDIQGTEGPKIGVLLCGCGDEVSSILDIPGILESSKALPDVVYADEVSEICTVDGSDKVIGHIKEHGLNRVVIGGCSPRILEPILTRTISNAGVDPYLFEIANLREQCAWVHREDKAMATEKAAELISMAVSKVRSDIPLPIIDIPSFSSAMVLGGGLSGLTSALALSSRGFDVHLIEKEKELGGHLRHIKHLIKGDADPQGHLSSLIEKVSNDPRIQLYTSTTTVDLEGVPGLFTSKISGPGGEKVINHGAIIVATGGIEYEPTEHLYGKNKKVVTQSELEELISSGGFDGSQGTVVMIQCVGSRNDENPGCSRICCTVAVKNALKLKQMNGSTEVIVLHKDIRTYGLMEDSYREARGNGVQFKRSQDDSAPSVNDKDGKPRVTFHDPILDQKVVVTADLVVLSAAIRPNPDNESLARLLTVPLSKDGFMLEAHMKLRPVDLSREGIYVCGLAHGPKSVRESIVQATAAASQAAKLLSRTHVKGVIMTAEVDSVKCRGCGRCEVTCEYSAITIVSEPYGKGERMVSKVDEARCKGCGKCSVVCCNKSINMKHFTTNQIEKMIEAALESVSI